MKGLPDTLAEDVRSELTRLGSAPGGGDMAELVTAWRACVGGTIAENAWPARFARDGTLVVHTSSSTWAFELAHLEEMIRERLGSLAPRRLKFVVGAIPSPGAESVPAVSKPLHRVSPADRAKGDEIARPIENPELRELAARAAAASLARASKRSEPTGPSGRLVNG